MLIFRWTRCFFSNFLLKLPETNSWFTWKLDGLGDDYSFLFLFGAMFWPIFTGELLVLGGAQPWKRTAGSPEDTGPRKETIAKIIMFQFWTHPMFLEESLMSLDMFWGVCWLKRCWSDDQHPVDGRKIMDKILQGPWSHVWCGFFQPTVS